ncbi:hypothetical protein FL966_01620 [Caproiciproducens galactitolivorans]|uniref:Uncharacterized protein n=1 Tax=Caproiciproducens galactitolivorans TaxID=642589 RepID=A0A4Z0Y9A8_9FIRM|nr:hypothetical protein [Caproiciproducens galactitolivorans]QEY33845.1 hypothetical protein FL966_01620 [Caproiciproducens galactitolivorans]TGJ75540.1 hypothetical protein CAGA_23400 [Caproiciproducens galactitolivorans]
MNEAKENGIKVEKSEEIAQKIAKLLEAEKCTVSEAYSILRMTGIIVNNSTFTVQNTPVGRIRGMK